MREAVALFDVIETLDRPKLARALAEEIMRSGLSAASLRSGQYWRGAAEGRHSSRRGRDFIALCRETFGLAIDGLMCIPPLDEEPATHFALLAKIAQETASRS